MRHNATDTPILSRPELHGSDIAEVIESLPPHHRTLLNEALGFDAGADVAARLLAVSRGKSEAKHSAAWVLLQASLDAKVLLPADVRHLRELVPADVTLTLPPLVEDVDNHVKARKPVRWKSDAHLALLLATDCRDAQGFDFQAYAEFHDALIARGLLSRETSVASHEYTLLRGLEEAGVFFRDQRHGYILWRASGSNEQMGFAEFMSDPANLDGMRVHGLDRERIELAEQQDRRRALEIGRHQVIRDGRAEKPFLTELRALAESPDLDAPEKYFGALATGSVFKGFRPESWLERPVNYPGREDVDIVKLGARWLTAFRAFLTHRQKDYETEKEVRSSLHALADYVLLYLPWWMERHPTTTLDYPDSPKKFLRYFYVNRTRFSEEESSTGELPKTLNELLALRRFTPDSRNNNRRHFQAFFQFVITFFEDNEDYAGRGMQNPFRTDFDNEVAGARTKTNKVPFSDDVFPFLVHYGQAVEAFGEFLQAQAYERDALKTYPNGLREGYDTSQWGYVPVFWYRGKRYSVSWIPNIYRVAKRLVNGNPQGTSGFYVCGFRINRGPDKKSRYNVPHLTAVRMLNGLVETGLRGQSMQWLDRRHFDKLSPPVARFADLYSDPSMQDFHALYVNTDKTHNEWDNLVSWRVRRSLLAEAYFQGALADAPEVEVRYEDRENTRFLPIVPLFRSDLGDKPLSDNGYAAKWVDMLYGFEQFYNRKDGIDRTDTADALILVKPRDGAPETGRLDQLFQAIHTPHSCRSTYATLKDGDLEVSEIAQQLGHSNTTVTNHYQVPNAKKLAAKLKARDALELGRVKYDPAGTSEAYLHPEREDSAVRKAFQSDRQRAIADFGFVPGVALWSLSELDGNPSTLELLRQSPASVIRWHATHACPVGNQCPREVVVNTGGMDRCGICPLAAKCVDHLPAIEAKQNELRENIRSTAARLDHQTKAGAPQAELNALHRSMQLDTKELLGWKLSAEILRRKQQELGQEGSYHVDQPELVRKQLMLVTRNQKDSEFFLQRISDSNAYPSLESAALRAKANRFTRLMLARQGRLEDAAFLDVPAHEELTVFASLVKPFVDAKGFTISDLAAEMDALPQRARLGHAPPGLLLPGS